MTQASLASRDVGHPHPPTEKSTATSMPRQASVHELTQPGDWWLSVLVSQERAMKLRFGVLRLQSISEGLSL